MASAVEITRLIQQSRATLLAAEVVDNATLDLIYDIGGLRKLWPITPSIALLLEVDVVPDSIDLPTESLFADTPADKATLWQYREQASDCWTQSGQVHKLDVSVDPSSVGVFADEVSELLSTHAEVSNSGFFGHIADGNLHIEFTGPQPSDFVIDELLLELVARHGGSISAEHGIGRAKSTYLHLAHDPTTIATMRNLKALLDPNNTLNPGVLFG
jgi:FAD/FMN-containing dehydrogenase